MITTVQFPKGPSARRTKADAIHAELLRVPDIWGTKEFPLSREQLEQQDCLSLRDETAYALGKKNQALASLYARLTGRRMEVVDSAREVLEGANPGVVIATWDQLTVPDLELFYEFSRTARPLGLLVAGSKQHLRMRILISAASLWRGRISEPLPRLPASAIVALDGSEKAASHFDHLAGLDCDPQAVNRLLNGPSSILGFLGHSDGVDARLSSRATLCSRLEPAPVDLGMRPPNCDTTGYCHRRHLARSDAIASGSLISPRTAAARLVIMMSCYVARPADCSVHPHNGLMFQLLHNPRVGAVIAPWEVAYPSVAELLEMAAPLLAGHILGEALADFYRQAPGAVRQCNRYLLFGDPATRVAAAAAAAKEAGPADRPPVPATIAGDRTPARTVPQPIARWFRSRLERFARVQARNSAGELKISEDSLADAFNALEVLERNGPEAAAHEALLRVLLAYEGSSFVHWFEDAAELPEYVDRPTICFGCGAKGRLFRVVSRFGARWLACCTQCDSFYADAPEGSALIDAKFSVNARGRIAHTLPTWREGVVMMNLRSPLEERTTWKIEEPFDFSTLPPGRAWLWLHALSEDGLTSYSRIIDNRPITRGASDAR
jgi:hypothetical protein